MGSFKLIECGGCLSSHRRSATIATKPLSGAGFGTSQRPYTPACVLIEHTVADPHVPPADAATQRCAMAANKKGVQQPLDYQEKGRAHAPHVMQLYVLLS